MQANRRLAAAGAALDHDQAGVGLRDELELTRIDERGDLAQVLVVTVRQRTAYAEPSATALGASGRALSAAEAELAFVEADPAVLARMRELALRSLNSPQGSVEDGHAAA